MTADILFRSATVVPCDPSGSPPHIADVLVSGTFGTIISISAPHSIAVGEDVRVIESEGYWLTPGFIDMHAHSDLYLMTHSAHEAKISQGCTVSKLGLRYDL